MYPVDRDKSTASQLQRCQNDGKGKTTVGIQAAVATTNETVIFAIPVVATVFLKRPGPLCYDLGLHCAMSAALCFHHSSLNRDVHCATRPLAGALCYENVSKSVTAGVCGPPRSTLNHDVQCAMDVAQCFSHSTMNHHFIAR